MMHITDLDDHTLLAMRTNCLQHLANMRKRPAIYHALNRLEVQQDLQQLEREIESRLPVAFKWEVEKIQLGLTQPSHHIAPGNSYRHKVLPVLRLQIVNEYDYNGPLWSARLFIGKAYACRIIIKTSTLLEHFTRIEP